MIERVFHWSSNLDDSGDPVTAPLLQPVVRIWGDVLLELIAERRGMGLVPTVAIRRTAVFAWASFEPPASLASFVSARSRVELTVDASRCAAARGDLADPLLDPGIWSGIRSGLVERGFEEGELNEDVTPFVAPMERMRVAGARAIVESTDSLLLEALLHAFEPIARPYLLSWHAFENVPDTGAWEVVVPPEAILDVGRP